MTTHTSTRRFLVMAIVAMTMAASFPLAQKVSDAELLFREAQHKQQVERDLNGAIKLYESIAASKTADRAVKAKALLQLASCYELQGKQAEKVYDQIVRDFKDQAAVVAQAQTKLAALRPRSSSPTIKKIEVGNGVRHVVATDGTRALYLNDDSTTLYFGDVAGRARNVVVTAQLGQHIRGVQASPDLSMVYLESVQGVLARSGKGTLKNTDGTGGRELDVFEWFTRAFGRPPGPMTLTSSFEWSGNGRYLLASVQRDLQTHLAKISVDDGQVTVLPPLSRPFVTAVSSPDDRFIALGGESGLYIIPSQGGGPRQLMADAPGVVTWTGDGQYILFRVPQSGAVFALPMKDGQPAGERIAIAGEYRPFGTYGAANVLRKPVETQSPSRQRLYLASLNDDGRLSRWNTQDIVGGMGSYPTWSPDGRQFAYVAFRGAGIENPIRVHTVAGGEERVLFSGLRHTVVNGTIGNCLWAASQPTIYCGVFQRTTPVQTKVISIATDTGRMEEVGTLNGVRFFDRFGPDDRTLISVLKGGSPARNTVAHRWEIGARQEKETPFAGVVDSNVTESPDGRWVYRVVTDSSNRREYQIRPTSGSDSSWRHLMYVNRPALAGARFIPVRYTPDSKWILYHDKDASGKDGLFRVSTSGGEPQRLGDYPTSDLSSLMSISPDGRQILVHVDLPWIPGAFVDMEFALLENINPTAAPAAPKPAAKGVRK